MFGSGDLNVWFPSSLLEAGEKKAADPEHLSFWECIGVEILHLVVKAMTFVIARWGDEGKTVIT